MDSDVDVVDGGEGKGEGGVVMIGVGGKEGDGVGGEAGGGVIVGDDEA